MRSVSKGSRQLGKVPLGSDRSCRRPQPLGGLQLNPLSIRSVARTLSPGLAVSLDAPVQLG
jgi:hypothetical protein